MARDPNQDKTTKLLLECTIVRIGSCVVVNIDVLRGFFRARKGTNLVYVPGSEYPDNPPPTPIPIS